MPFIGEGFHSINNLNCMKRIDLFSVVLITAILVASCRTKPEGQDQTSRLPRITVIDKSTENRIDVNVDGELFTSYRWPEDVFKPILYPVFNAAGTEITRGFPLHPRVGERADHAHHTGVWLTYGNVNGLDFWGNGSQGLGIQNENGGVIRHLKVVQQSNGLGKGTLTTLESWTDRKGEVLLKEKTGYHFIASGSIRIIDRFTALTAGDIDISLPDTKEGMFGIRVARQLELTSEEKISLLGENGAITERTELPEDGISGNYRSSEGITGLDVWGTRARWMNLFGQIGEEKVSIVICDHPKNPGYPTYWHARGYGLFAANPLGWTDFTGGKEHLNFRIPAGETVTFSYRMIISSGAHLGDADIMAYADEFDQKY